MSVHVQLGTKELALAAIFTALYVVLGALKISPIIGLPGQGITAAAIIAPIIGIIFGPYVGVLSTFLGGVIGISLGYFSQLSLASGVTAALCSGMTAMGRRIASIIVYFCLLLIFAFYPVIGPAWLYPQYLWFQIIGFIILISPLQSLAVKIIKTDDGSMLFYTFFITSLTSTLAGQIAGSTIYELIISSDLSGALGTWLATVFLYPTERVIIAIVSAVIGSVLFKVLKNANLLTFSNSPHR
ncbi:MAG: hypothetical protein QW468_04640 [Candidatus Bathyarchaeia archaeon]